MAGKLLSPTDAYAQGRAERARMYEEQARASMTRSYSTSDLDADAYPRTITATPASMPQTRTIGKRLRRDTFDHLDSVCRDMGNCSVCYEDTACEHCRDMSTAVQNIANVKADSSRKVAEAGAKIRDLEGKVKELDAECNALATEYAAALSIIEELRENVEVALDLATERELVAA